MLFKKQIDDLDEEDIMDLISNGVEENIHLDYKQELPLRQDDKGKIELAKDVSAFANSNGGFIIYGVEETGHKPTGIIGIDPEGTRERIENICLRHIHPHINVRIKSVDLKGIKKQVFVVWIPISSFAPHMVNFRFYKRQNFSSVPMEEYEVRELYRRNFEYKSQVDLFLLKKNYGLNNPNNDDNLWVSFITCPYFLSNKLMPVNEEMKDFLDPNKYHLKDGRLLFSNLPQYHLNGFIIQHPTIWEGNENEEIIIQKRMVCERTGYVQLGIYYDRPDKIPIVIILYYIECFLRFAISFYEKTEYFSDIKFILSMQNLQNWRIPLNQFNVSIRYRGEDLKISRDFSFLYLKENYKILTKDVMDQLFQAFGQRECFFIDINGEINI